MNSIIRRIASFLLCVWLLSGTVFGKELIPGGQVIGLELCDRKVVVAGFDEQQGQVAQTAGLKNGDVIQKIDDVTIHSADDIRKALKCSDGVVTVEICRDGKVQTLRIVPYITQDGPRLGVYLRQGITGIGTVTWYDPDSNKFGTLGHGVNDGNGNLLPLQEGRAYSARVMTVKKGKCGEPGQLIGAIKSPKPIGTLTANTPQGVFGNSDTISDEDAISVAHANEIKTGDAVIRSTVSGETPREYSVKILKIYPKSRTNGRNLLLRVTDPALLETTGGIVQGMSGSPIIQSGKIVGAVTHVLVNDPTTGYGIFIENMLDAAS